MKNEKDTSAMRSFLSLLGYMISINDSSKSSFAVSFKDGEWRPGKNKFYLHDASKAHYFDISKLSIRSQKRRTQ